MTRGALVALLALAACSRDDRLPDPVPGAGATSPRRGGTLRVSIISDIRTLDPLQISDQFSILGAHELYDTLLDYGEATQPEPLRLRPELAERYTVSPDGTVYDFFLRDGLFYEDGSPIEAGDFKYQLERILDPTQACPFRPFFDAIATLEAPDARHLRITLHHPDAVFPMLLAMPYVSPTRRAWVEAQGPHIGERPLASGPFRLAEYRTGDRIVFERNPRYWNARTIYLDRIVLYLNVPRDVAVLKFLSGELDVVEWPASDDFLRFLASPAWRTQIVHQAAANAFGEEMNVRKWPFSDRRVRLALNYAVRKQDTEILYQHRARVAHGIIPPMLPDFDESVAPYPYDPDRARALLAEAGLPHGFDVTYTTYADDYTIRIAQSLQSDLAQVGVRTHIQILTFPAYVTALQRQQLEFAVSSWYMDFPDPWDFLYVKFATAAISEDGGTNESAWSEPAFDGLVSAARQEQDPARRREMYRAAERILIDAVPWIFHYHLSEVEVLQGYVRNYLPHPVWIRSWRETWLDK